MAAPCPPPRPLQAPRARPDANALRTNGRARVLLGTLSTETAQRQSTLSRFLVRSAAVASTREGDDGVIEIIDSDDDGVIANAATDDAVGAPLPSGVVLLRGFLSLAQQHDFIKAVDAITNVVPLTIPEVKHPFTGEPAFANVYMTYAGRTWDGTKATYFPSGAREAVFENLATGANVPVPPVPPVILTLAEAAVAEALRLEPGVFESPAFDASSAADFTCIFNYYASWSSISPHADSSEPSLKAGKTFPVVSFSVGDTAVFSLFPDATKSGSDRIDNGPPLNVLLKSGDVLLFGGASRLIRHSVEEIKSVGAGGVERPQGLRMVDGRLNVTLRAL